MEPTNLHRDVRELITETDSLSRQAHASHRDREAEVFASLRTSLVRLDRRLGAQVPLGRALLAGSLDVFYLRVRDVVARAPVELREAATALVLGAGRLHEEAIARPVARAVERLDALLRFLPSLPPPLPARAS